MKEPLLSLMKLQEMDARLDDFTRELSRLGPDREKAKADFERFQSECENAKKSLIQAHLDKKNLELDIETREQAIRKHSGELNSVKSNEAYKGLLTQIEDAKKSKGELEDKVLEIMERMDSLQKDAKEWDARLKQEKNALDQKLAALDAEEARFKAEFEAKNAERDASYQALKEDMRQAYDNVRRGRRGVKVLSEIKNGTCGGCRMSLPQSVINSVMKSGDLVVCETCTRILYLPPKEEPSSPENAASSPAVS